MPFDIEKMLSHIMDSVNNFHELHKDETFYAFVIDAELLCMNSVEKYEKCLEEMRLDWEFRTRELKKWEELTKKDIVWTPFIRLNDRKVIENPLIAEEEKAEWLRKINEHRQKERIAGYPYGTSEHIKEVKENTGDWAYQGFACFGDGFDQRSYDEHYDMNAEEQKKSEYGIAMDKLVNMLKQSDVFSKFNKTDDFYITRIEHNY